MANSFVTYLGTDSFLPGVLSLNKSIRKYNSTPGLVVMVSDTISEDVLKLLREEEIKIKVVKEIKNPHDLGDDSRGFKHMYTKLRLFEMVEFNKIVYIDADMLVCNNIEALFDCSHMSAVVAGGLLPINSTWKDLNAGLMIVEPDQSLFNKIYASIDNLPSNDGSDQGFLHSFYKDWPTNKGLHLNHTYNVPFCYIDDYCQLDNYQFEYKRKSLDTNISVIHYWGRYKPWEMDIKSLKRRSAEKWEQALILWWDTFLEASA